LSVFLLREIKIKITDLIFLINYPALTICTRYKQLGCQGAVNAVSFTHQQTKPDKDTGNHHLSSASIHPPNVEEEGHSTALVSFPNKSTLERSQFVVNDFSVSTDRAQYLYFQTDGSKTTVAIIIAIKNMIVQGHNWLL